MQRKSHCIPMYFFSNSPVKWRCKSGQDQNAILNTILKFISPSRKWFFQFLHHQLHNKITYYQEWFREISGEADARTRMNRKSITGGKDRVRTWDFEPDWRRKRTKDKLESWDGLLFSHDEFSRVFESEEGKTSIRWKNERVQRVKIRFGVNVAEFSQRLRFLQVSAKARDLSVQHASIRLSPLPGPYSPPWVFLLVVRSSSDVART